MKATIITIGDEILIGQIVDTNSVSIARHLNAAGIVVHEKESVGDDREAIVAALRRAMSTCEVTILTGGLGPTKDDITKRTLAELFGYATAIRSLTRGRASYSMEPSHFERVPKQIQDKVTEKK